MQRKTVTGMFVTAEDVNTKRPVLIKVINKKGLSTDDTMRLQRELRVALTLSHPHIIST